MPSKQEFALVAWLSSFVELWPPLASELCFRVNYLAWAGAEPLLALQAKAQREFSGSTVSSKSGTFSKAVSGAAAGHLDLPAHHRIEYLLHGWGGKKSASKKNLLFTGLSKALNLQMVTCLSGLFPRDDATTLGSIQWFHEGCHQAHLFPLTAAVAFSTAASLHYPLLLIIYIYETSMEKKEKKMFGVCEVHSVRGNMQV